MNYETIVWLLLIAAALITDGLQTRWAVKNGFQEGWPIANLLLKKFSMDEVILLVKGVGFSFFFLLTYLGLSEGGLATIAAVSTFPVVWNFWKINR